MSDFFIFGSTGYWLMLLALLFARGMDMLSTRIATPNLVLEGNPIAKMLGWTWGIPVNVGICLIMAFWPLPSIVLSTTSILVAARNFQSAWLMRSMGEEAYRDWHVARIQETPVTLFLLCLAGNTALFVIIGVLIIVFSKMDVVLFGIGAGVVAYGGAVAFYTLLALWRLRRASLRREEKARRHAAREESLALQSQPLAAVCARQDSAAK